MLTVDADLPLGEALAQLAAAGVSTLVVQVAGQAAGILTEHDWLRLLREQSPLNCPVGELMSTPLVAVSPEMEVDAAESLMQTRGIRHLALIDEDGRLQGVVSAATTWLAQRQSLRQSPKTMKDGPAVRGYRKSSFISMSFRQHWNFREDTASVM